jgi:hypothetical protein
MYDPYDGGIPKYTTAEGIYEALCELVQTEEMNILEDIGVTDVSYEGQNYYYTDEGNKLKTKFEGFIGWDMANMWLLNMAVFQINHEIEPNSYEYYVTDRRGIADIHDVVYEALYHPALAARLKFKSLFVDKVLHGYKQKYEAVVEVFEEELRELSRFGEWENIPSLGTALRGAGLDDNGMRLRYAEFTRHLHDRAMGLGLDKEKQLIIECRALLTSYDDFILGLRMNQALADRIGAIDYRNKKLELEAKYDEAVRQLASRISAELGIDAQVLLGWAPALELSERANVVIEDE